MNPQCAQPALEIEAKTARFIDGVDVCFGPARLELRRPVQEGFLGEALRRLGLAAAQLHDHDLEALMDINPELDRAAAPIKLRAGSLG